MIKKNKKIKRYEFGLESITDNLKEIIPYLSSIGGNNSIFDTAANVSGGILSGSKFGVPGSVVGGGLGLFNSLKNIESNSINKQMESDNQNRIKSIRRSASLSAMSNEMAQDYELRNPIIPTFKNGGISIKNKAYLDDGEIVNYPNGDILEVIGNPNVTDDVLTNLPPGSDILSNKLKIPGTNETFAKKGKELEKIYNKKYKNNDSFSTMSKKLNDKYVEKEMRNLKISQSLLKKQSGNKNDIPSYAFGLEDDPSKNKRPTVNNNLYVSKYQTPLVRKVDPDMARTVGTFDNPQNPMVTNIPKFTPGTSIPSKEDLDYLRSSEQEKKIGDLSKLPARTDIDVDYDNMLDGPDKLNLNFDPSRNIITDYLSLSPYRYNVSEGNTPYDIVNPAQNPYSDQINRSMRARRISMEPTRQALNRQRSISRYNSNNMTGTGQNMAYSLASNAMTNRAEVDAINQAQQINNNYVSDYGNVLNSLGQQSVQGTVYAEDMNAKNKAARDLFKSTASTQIGQFAQNKQLMHNQKNRDLGILDALTPYLREGFDSRTLDGILKKLKL